MADELKEMLKKGSKAKLIQLAIDSPEFSTDGLPNRKLTDKEIEIIKKKAQEEGWGGELYRATYKAKDIELMAIKTTETIYKALFYLQEYKKVIERAEVLLNILEDKYIRGYNEKTEKFEEIVKKTKEEVKEDVFEITKNLNIFSVTESLFGLKTKFDKGDDKKPTSGDIFNLYKNFINDGKVFTYFVVRAKFGGYRLYKKENLTEIELAFGVINQYALLDLIDSLDHLDYLLENLEKYTPEVEEEVRKQELVYIPTRKEIKKRVDYINKYLWVSSFNEEGKVIEMDREKREKLIRETLLSEGYLLNTLSDKEREELIGKDNVLEEYVRYGK